MSTQRLAILAAVGTSNMMRNSSEASGGGVDHHGHHYGGREHSYMSGEQRSSLNGGGNQFHGNVNVLLGGAMLSVFVTMVCFVCYCCHRNLRKRSESVYRQRWLDPDANMEIYSVAQCYDLSPEPRVVAAVAALEGLHHQHQQQQQHQQPSSLSPSLPLSAAQGPPPSYETVIAMDQSNDSAVVGCDKCLAVAAQMQQRSACSFANCNHNALLLQQQQLLQHHAHLPPPPPPPPPFLIKTDNELNNNAAAGATASIAAVQQSGSGVREQTRRIVHCNCELYPSCCTGGGTSGQQLFDNDVDAAAEHQFEFTRECKHCGCLALDSDGNYSCDCLEDARATSLPVAALGASRPADNTASSTSALADEHNGNGEAGGTTTTGGHVDNGNGAAEPTTSTMAVRRSVSMSTSANNNRAPGADVDDAADDGANVSAATAANCACNGHGSSNGHNQQQQPHRHQRQHCDCCRSPTAAADNGGGPNNNVDLDAFNAAGVIRMDMSQIIDQTGLPTYEAALKFESSGYV